MRIAKVVGTVTLNRCHPSLHRGSYRLAAACSLDELVHQRDPLSEEMVVYDELGASVSSFIAVSEGREAAQPFGPEGKPVDAYVAAILDHVDIEVSDQ